MICIITFSPRNAFNSSTIVSKLRPFYIAYLFVSITMILRNSFIPVTVWIMSKCVEPWSRSTSASVSKVYSFWYRLFFILPFPFLSGIGFFLLCFFVLVLRDTALFWFVLFSSDRAFTFSFFRFVFDHWVVLLFLGIFG